MKYLLLIILIFTFIYADDHHHEEDKKHKHYYSKDLRYLDLTHHQKKQIKKLLKEYRAELESFIKLKKKLTQEKKELFQKGSFSKEELKAINQLNINQSTKIEFHFLQQMQKLLTPKQKEQFVRYIDEWEVE